MLSEGVKRAACTASRTPAARLGGPAKNREIDAGELLGLADRLSRTYRSEAVNGQHRATLAPTGLGVLGDRAERLCGPAAGHQPRFYTAGAPG